MANYQSQHKEHAATLRAAITKIGGTPVEERSRAEYAKIVTAAAPKNEADVLKLASKLEKGAANAYLGLRAGMTIAATYPAAVIGMAVLRLMKGSILEENIARTIGSIGESVAAGA